MARRTFFSFHYQYDIFRVNQIRNIPNITSVAAAGFADASLWEEARTKGDAAVEKLIDDGLEYTTVTVVCVGEKTAGRKYINYEINESIKRGNGIVAIQIHHLIDHKGNTDSPGAIPSKIENNPLYKAYKYTNVDALGRWIEEAAKAVGR